MAPATAWQTDKENHFLSNKYCWAAEELNVVIVDPLAASLPKYPWRDCYHETPMRMYSNMLIIMESKEPSSYKVQSE